MKRLMCVLVLVLAACGEPEAEDFDRSCQVDEDCVVVGLARSCDCPERVAVNKSDRRKVEAANDDESSWFCIASVDCLYDENEIAFCDAGTCALKISKNVPAN